MCIILGIRESMGIKNKNGIFFIQCVQCVLKNNGLKVLQPATLHFPHSNFDCQYWSKQSLSLSKVGRDNSFLANNLMSSLIIGRVNSLLANSKIFHALYRRT